MCHYSIAARDQLKKWREENERKSEEIVDLWINFLGTNAGKLGDESKFIVIVINCYPRS